MSKNKKIRLTIIILLTIMLLISFKLFVYAESIEDNLDLFDPKSNQISEPDLEEKANTILGTINVVGIIVSVVTIVIIGMKYMLGSVEEKAEYKQTMIIYLIGAILLFSITTIANILYNIGITI